MWTERQKLARFLGECSFSAMYVLRRMSCKLDAVARARDSAKILGRESDPVERRKGSHAARVVVKDIDWHSEECDGVVEPWRRNLDLVHSCLRRWTRCLLHLGA